MSEITNIRRVEGDTVVAEPQIEPLATTPPVEEPAAPVVPDPSPEPVAPVSDPVPQYDFGAVLKEKYGVDEDGLRQSLERAQLLKDDYITEAVKYYGSEGSLAPYLEAHSYDYDNMSPVDVLRLDIKRKDPEISKETLEWKVQQELRNTYHQVDIEETDENGDPIPGVADIKQSKVAGAELLMIYSKRRKAEWIEAQKKFRAPDRQAEQAPDMSGFIEKVLSNPTNVQLKESKTVKFGEFSYGVQSPDEITSMMLDDTKFWGLFKEGETVNFDKLQRTLVFAKDPQKVTDSLIAHGKALALAEIAKEDKNLKPPTQPQPNSETGLFKNIRQTGG